MLPVYRPTIRRASAAATVALLVGACGGGGGKKAAAPTTTASTGPTITAPATTTTPPPPPIAPLTGLPQPDAAKLSRVALVLKVDNVDAARPQAGLGAADVVFEEMVEFRLTRLIAVFQSTDSDRVGPVRSTRTTDIAIVSALNHPLYGYSGGNANYVAQLRAAPITDVGADSVGGAYFRSGPFPQPHNLYTSTSALFRLASGAPHPPSPLFAYRAGGATPANAGAAPASHLDVNFGSSSASWDWDAASQTWKRGQNGSADVDQAGQQLAATNVIVQLIPYTTDGYASGEGINPPPPIPKGQTVGTGTAVVITGAMVIQAHWSKASDSSVTQYTDSAGQPILLAPGRTWVELAPIGTTPNVH